MQVHRLFEIIYLLLDKGQVTAKELSEKFEVSERTIYRDLDILSSANIPIYCTKGRNGGIKLLDNFVLNKSLLTEKEQNEILFSLKSLTNLNTDEEDSKILGKLETLFHKNSSNWIDIDFSKFGNSNEKEKFEIIKNAILNKKKISFEYYNTNGEKNDRVVEPLQLCFKSKSWYLKAYCNLKNSYRVFKITRIRNIILLEESFDKTLPEIILEGQNISLVTVTLNLSSNLGYRVYDEFEEENIVKNDDGSFTVTFTMPEDEWVYGYILSFGEQARVESPTHIKMIIKKRLEKTLQNYS